MKLKITYEIYEETHDGNYCEDYYLNDWYYDAIRDTKDSCIVEIPEDVVGWRHFDENNKLKEEYLKLFQVEKRFCRGDYDAICSAAKYYEISEVLLVDENAILSEKKYINDDTEQNYAWFDVCETIRCSIESGMYSRCKDCNQVQVKDIDPCYCTAGKSAAKKS